MRHLNVAGNSPRSYGAVSGITIFGEIISHIYITNYEIFRKFETLSDTNLLIRSVLLILILNNQAEINN